MIKALRFVFMLPLLANILFGQSAQQSQAIIPITRSNADPQPATTKNESTLAAITEFVASIKDGNGNLIRGLYAANRFALKVIQQPVNDYSFVSTREGEVTQFQLAAKYGTIGFLAHNFLSGSFFSKLELGDVIQVVYGDGRVDQFKIQKILQYQALQPTSPKSQFVNLSGGQVISAAQLFKEVYSNKDQLVLQTCLEKNGVDTWGRVFLIAKPIR